MKKSKIPFSRLLVRNLSKYHKILHFKTHRNSQENSNLLEDEDENYVNEFLYFPEIFILVKSGIAFSQMQLVNPELSINVSNVEKYHIIVIRYVCPAGQCRHNPVDIR
jgi:hypothetical protein